MKKKRISDEQLIGVLREAQAEVAVMRGQIHAICAEFPRYVYRGVTEQLKSDGWAVNHKRIARPDGQATRP
ncbi:MAG: IS3 family transposase [Aquisalimonadaceae bacterium]